MFTLVYLILFKAIFNFPCIFAVIDTLVQDGVLQLKDVTAV